jgi:hypothetical protein
MSSPEVLILKELAHDQPAPGLLGLAERGLLPDTLLRLGVRQQCAARLRAESAGGAAAQEARQQQLLAQLRASAVALHTAAANAQHYELPPQFFRLCLGRRLKYSCAYYARGDETLDEAEEAMLALYGERACRRPGDSRAWLRLGVAHLVDGRALPARAHLRGLQLSAAARVHRGAVRTPRPQQRQRPDVRCESPGAAGGAL